MIAPGFLKDDLCSLRMALPDLPFYLGSGDLNSGPHAYTASTLATEPGPQPWEVNL